MSIFDNLDQRIKASEDEETALFAIYQEAEDRYWKAVKTNDGLEYATILEKLALAKASKASQRTHALESIKMLEPVKDADIDSLKSSFNEILTESHDDENSVFIGARFDDWAKAIDPAFSFAGWGDAKKGTQGYFPIFNIHFPRGKHTVKLMQNINIMARALRRDIDYVVDFTTSKEGAGKKRPSFIFSVSGEGMHLAAVNYMAGRHKWPKAFSSFENSLYWVSYHGGDQSYKAK